MILCIPFEPQTNLAPGRPLPLGKEKPTQNTNTKYSGQHHVSEHTHYIKQADLGYYMPSRDVKFLEVYLDI